MSLNQKIDKICGGDISFQLRIKRYFYSFEKLLDESTELCDSSFISFRDLLDALDFLSNWLYNKSLYMNLQNKIQYLSCVIESLNGSKKYSLNFINELESFLDLYGCEKAIRLTNSYD